MNPGDLPHGIAAQVYVVANIAIALGYLSVPWLVLPYLSLRRRTVVAGGVFFIGCTGSHVDMVYDVIAGHGDHPPVGWVAVWWHVVQAAGTWAFILLFRSELTRADDLLEQVRATAADTDRIVSSLPREQTDDLTDTLAALRVQHPPKSEDPFDVAVSKLPARGEWVKAAPGVFMVCGTITLLAFLIVFTVLTVTGESTADFFRLMNLFLNALGAVGILSLMVVGLVHARRTLENREIALRSQKEAHRAADKAAEAASTSQKTARQMNGDLDVRIRRAVQDALDADDRRGEEQDRRGRRQDMRGEDQDRRDARDT